MQIVAGCSHIVANNSPMFLEKVAERKLYEEKWRNKKSIIQILSVIQLRRKNVFHINFIQNMQGFWAGVGESNK